jgi:hypothetical protein
MVLVAPTEATVVVVVEMPVPAEACARPTAISVIPRSSSKAAAATEIGERSVRAVGIRRSPF